jgi:hypothetical protein
MTQWKHWQRGAEMMLFMAVVVVAAAGAGLVFTGAFEKIAESLWSYPEWDNIELTVRRIGMVTGLIILGPYFLSRLSRYDHLSPWKAPPE